VQVHGHVDVGTHGLTHGGGFGLHAVQFRLAHGVVVGVELGRVVHLVQVELDGGKAHVHHLAGLVGIGLRRIVAASVAIGIDADAVAELAAQEGIDRQPRGAAHRIRARSRCGVRAVSRLRRGGHRRTPARAQLFVEALHVHGILADEQRVPGRHDPLDAVAAMDTLAGADQDHVRPHAHHARKSRCPELLRLRISVIFISSSGCCFGPGAAAMLSTGARPSQTEGEPSAGVCGQVGRPRRLIRWRRRPAHPGWQYRVERRLVGLQALAKCDRPTMLGDLSGLWRQLPRC
jgi:hypothetical protein